MTTVPLRNLGPAAEPWGRSVDERLAALLSSQEQAQSVSSNGNRLAMASIQGVGSQVSELFARQTQFVYGESMATEYFTTGSSPMETQRITLPRPDGGRRAGWIAVQAVLDLDGPEDAWSSGFLSYRLDGSLIGAFTYGLPFVGAGLQWFKFGSSASYSAFIASEDSGGVLDIELSGSGAGSASSKRVTLSDVKISVQYGQRVV